MNTANTAQNINPTIPIVEKIITIKDIELCTHAKRTPGLARQYNIEFCVGNTNTSHLTKKAKEIENRTSWNEKFFLELNITSDGNDSSVLVIMVYRKHRIGKIELVGTFTNTIGEVLRKVKDGVLEETLRKHTSDGSDSGITIKFSITAESREGRNADERQATDAFAQATAALGSLGSIPPAVDLLGSVVDTGTTTFNEVQAFETTWGVLLERMELFNKFVTDIAMIHPYASLAWSVISAANKILVNQKNRDDQIIHLAETMSDVFKFVQDAEPLKAIKAHINPITLLIKQVTECGYFIAVYAKQKSFWIRTAKYTISDIDARITGYENKLRELKAAFLEQVTLQTGVTTIRMMNDGGHTAETIDLNDMPYAPGARYSREKGCLSGTRESLIREICDTLNNSAEGAPQVCVLTGVAGSGKSAVAHSVARLYDGQERLGSSYCFSSTDVARRNPGNLFSTIARDLSDHDLQYKSALWKIVKDNRALRTSTSPGEQVDRLIIEPSKCLDAIGPLVIVIDALDESGDSVSRRQLLQVISAQFAESMLPTHLRFLITARPESDILAAVSRGSQFVHKQIGGIPEEIVDGDIRRFIHHSLNKYSKLESSWPNEEWCQLLVDHSQHLFQWASTACSFIEGDGTAGLDPCERLRILLQSDDNESVHPLDKLYRTILEQQFILNSARRRFQEVMAIILELNEPLSLASLATLFGSRLKAAEIIQPLGSLLDGVVDEDRPIRPLHSSFRDFLLDETRSSTFHVHILPHHSLSLGQALLACMRDMLKFNMCDLKDSRLRNTAVPDLPHRVNKAIPPHLSYSCQYWMRHLQHADCTPNLLKDVILFFKHFFPYWLESLSLLSLSSPLSSIQSALEACTILKTWVKDQEIATLATEAFQFIQVFAPVLRESTPHLYLSAMPQTPSSSPLHTLWVDHLQKHISVTSGHPATWPAEVHALQGHTDIICSVAYSPNGKHIVSGSQDNTIRVWDATAGQTVSGPFQGHTDHVSSVAYSPNGKHIVSGSRDNTIRVWDEATGQIVAGPFMGHTDDVRSVTYSPDGKYIISGSGDHTIRVWDATTGQTVAGPFMEHTNGVRSIAYSPDGRNIVSGSKDGTIRIWDPSTGQCVTGPFQGHTDWVTSVAYSPDGRHVVSGSEDKTIRIWDAITGQTVAGPFMGHPHTFSSVAYSPDGNHIVSGSWNCTIRVWDATTGQTVAGPFQGHTQYVTFVGYSPDGRYVVSGSGDNSIRIWDVVIGQTVGGLIQGHTNYVNSVGYSPDGKHIVSGSGDHTIRVWDAITGQIVAGPFHGHTGTIWSVAYSPDGRNIVSGSQDETIRIWNAVTGQNVLDPFQGHTNYISSVAYSPDGKHIVSGSRDNTIRVWDATTGQTVAGPLQGHTNWLNSVAYSPDGKHIVSGSCDKTIRIWDATTGQTVTGPFQGHTSCVTCAAHSLDGRHIASGSEDNTIRVWDAATGQCVAGPFQGHTKYVTSVAYSPDGRHIVSGSGDKTIRVWDVTTGQCVAGPFQGHTYFVKNVVYSSNGKHIVSGSADHSIKIWRVDDFVLFDDFFVEDGWIQFSNGSLFGWVTPWNRHAFPLPIHSLVIQ